MEVFSAVVEEQGFSAASRRLRMPLPTVSRKISDLEDYLGTALLVRSTRKVTVTDSGRRYYEDIQSVLETIGEVERRASGEFQKVKGVLTITAPTLFGRLFVLPIANKFMRHHDQIDIRLNFTNHVLELPEERIDLGFRIGTPPSSGVTSTRIGSVRRIVCGSKRYIADKGSPSLPNDIMSHDIIVHTRSGPKPVWRFRSQTGKPIAVAVPSRLAVNTVEDAIDAMLLGQGLSQFYSYQVVAQPIRSEILIILSDYEEPEAPVSLILPKSDWMPLKVQAFRDFAVPILQDHLAEVARLCNAKS